MSQGVQITFKWFCKYRQQIWQNINHWVNVVVGIGCSLYHHFHWMFEIGDKGKLSSNPGSDMNTFLPGLNILMCEVEESDSTASVVLLVTLVSQKSVSFVTGFISRYCFLPWNLSLQNIKSQFLNLGDRTGGHFLPHKSLASQPSWKVKEEAFRDKELFLGLINFAYWRRDFPRSCELKKIFQNSVQSYLHFHPLLFE